MMLSAGHARLFVILSVLTGLVVRPAPDLLPASHVLKIARRIRLC